MVEKCTADNASELDQSSFWSNGSLHWDAHRIGWAIAGGCALATFLITALSVFFHARSYTRPAEQKQIIRILYMPSVYAIISFLSYRFFRVYTYYEFIEVIYEAVTLSAFLLLLIEYVATTASGEAEKALLRKEKKKLVFPFCCWRYRPTKAYFMYTLKWSVLQYVIIRPLVSLAGIICEAYGVLCESSAFDFQYASVYLQIIDFVSISIALYGLLLFYGLTKEELQGKRPLAKFMCIKLIVFFTFYQSFVFSALEGRVIHATEYWTSTNIADGLSALAICIEMVIFSLAMLWAYPAKEYRVPGVRTSMGKPLFDSIDYRDFFAEIWTSLVFFVRYIRREPTAHGHGHLPGNHPANTRKKNFERAFGFGDGYGNETHHERSSSTELALHPHPTTTTSHAPMSPTYRTPSARQSEDVQLYNPYDDRPYDQPPTQQYQQQQQQQRRY